MSSQDDRKTPDGQRAGRWNALGPYRGRADRHGAGHTGAEPVVPASGPGRVERQRVLSDLEPAPCIALAPAALKDWNVLLISIDTTRANHLNCYGYEYTKTPVLNRLARHGVLYSHAFTPSPATLPAHASLLTGRYPLHHGVRANGTFTLDDAAVTLAETLRESGYRTGAAVSAFVLDSRLGVDQGFDTYDDDLTVGMKFAPHMFRERAAELTNVPVRQWLHEHGKEKFFFWVHYFDPHAPARRQNPSGPSMPRDRTMARSTTPISRSANCWRCSTRSASATGRSWSSFRTTAKASANTANKPIRCWCTIRRCTCR